VVIVKQRRREREKRVTTRRKKRGGVGKKTSCLNKGEVAERWNKGKKPHKALIVREKSGRKSWGR